MRMCEWVCLITNKPFKIKAHNLINIAEKMIIKFEEYGLCIFALPCTCYLVPLKVISLMQPSRNANWSLDFTPKLK